jgi:imidazolonepropionase-like amidohydrolase
MIIFSNIRKLYDGTSASSTAIHHNVDLWVEGGIVKKMVPHQSKPPKGSDVRHIDCSTYTVTPGLIDCHGHVTLFGVSRTDIERMNSQEGLLYAERILYTTLVNGGVTTLRDVGGATHFLKRMVDDGVMMGPRLKIAICMLSTTGGHADFRGPDRCCGAISQLWPPGPGRPSSIVDGPWSCRKRIREIAACGADLVKICASPGVVSPTDKLEHRDFTAQEIDAICDEAAARGLYVAAHAHSHHGIELAIDHGVRDIQHISFLDERLAEKAQHKGCVVTPTSWVTQSLSHAQGLSKFVKKKVKQVGEAHARSVRMAYESGLPILAGTDPVLPHMHGRNYMEMVSLIHDGIDPLSAWYSATGLAGKWVGQADAGQLLADFRADLLVCNQDVVEDPKNFEKDALVEVIKDGVGYKGGIQGIPQATFEAQVKQVLEEGWSGD